MHKLYFTFKAKANHISKQKYVNADLKKTVLFY